MASCSSSWEAIIINASIGMMWVFHSAFAPRESISEHKNLAVFCELRQMSSSLTLVVLSFHMYVYCDTIRIVLIERGV